MRKPLPGNAKVAVAYVRVSTEEQQNGPEAQRAQIAKWAQHEGAAVVQHFEDRLSGARPVAARPGLMQALESLRQYDAGVLIVAKRDRIARDVIIAMTVERLCKARGAELVSADGVARGDDPANAFMRVVVDGAAAYERELIRARTKGALAAKAARGEFCGKAPYGFRVAADGVHLEQDRAEQAMLARAADLAKAGASLRTIALQLAAEGHLNRVKKRFGVSEVARILARMGVRSAGARPPKGPMEVFAAAAAPQAPQKTLACGRGHVHQDVNRVGSYCLRDECAAGRGTQTPERRIEWRQT